MIPFEERTDQRTGETYWAVSREGEALLDDPLLNKGTCFSPEEREAFHLHGLLPPGVATEEEQRARAYENYLRSGSDVQRYLFLAALQDRNETLFYRLLLDHLEEMAPIVYTPTVGKVCEQFSHIYRRPRGVYVSIEDRGRVVEILRHASLPDVRVIVATDNEAILGIGDQGVGGMGIPIGKLALYTAGGGFHPSRCLPLDIDVGTDNQALLDDPLYLGVPRRRARGREYDTLIDEIVDAIRDLFPRALLQWEDLSSRNAFRVLSRHRDRILSFNDDIEGTGAVVTAGIRSATHQVGRAMAEERIVFFGAGASGAGSALAVRRALAEAGVPSRELSSRVLCLDSKGLIVADRPGLEAEKAAIAAPAELVRSWGHVGDGPVTLEQVVSSFHPTVLVGASGQPGAFTEPIIRAMLRQCDRPVILPISNPTSKSEATPAELLGWTGGAAVVGTGSPFSPVEIGGTVHEIGQGNNVLVFPGVGLGAVAVEARRLTDEAFAAASRAVFECTDKSGRPGAPIYPPLSRLREISFRVALAVGTTLVSEGAAPELDPAAVEARIRAMIWHPVYRPYRRSST
ncbi:MAG TPA: NAD-dependent malic enzyme [Candidatus Eisenbacteria bacterium]|nr:NAD-dependent malic enzyme [Candidatus Eisenbacteria bacterium]